MATNHTCCNKQMVKKGLWSPEEDEKLVNFITKYGHGCWSTMPKYAGLERCGKSCRLRWINYLRPDLKKGSFTPQEAALVIECHKLVGNRWSHISHFLPGRTDNEVKNFWNSSLKRKIVAHQRHVESLKKAAAVAAAAAAAANIAQNLPNSSYGSSFNQNVYYVNPGINNNMNPNPQLNHQMFNMILPAPVTYTRNFTLNMSPPVPVLPVPVYAPAPVVVQAPAPVEVQAPVPVQDAPFSDQPAAWPVPENNPENLTQNNQNSILNYQSDDDFTSQFDDPNQTFLNDGNILNSNQDPSPSSSTVISFLPATVRKEFCVPLPSATQEQVIQQPLIAENQGIQAYESREKKVPPHHIDYFESRMAAFVASTPSSTMFATSSNYQQLDYNLMAPSTSSGTFRMDPTVASPSSSWDFSEYM